MGHTFNTTTRDTGYKIDTTKYTSETIGKQMIVIDSNMNVGMDRWNTNIHYKLDVSGKIRTTEVVIGSDRRYKRDIKPLDNIDKLFRVNSIKYKQSSEALHEQLELYRQNTKVTDSPDYAAVVASYNSQIAAADADTNTRFGFIAQEVRELYPELVFEDGHGFLSVNYIGLIPVLVSAIKELKSEISGLKGDKFIKFSTTEIASFAKLYQNNPNSFDTQTKIKYYIPSVAINATLCVYDMVGAEVLKMEIRGRESGSIVIDVNQLRAGSRGLSHAQPLFASAVVDNTTEIDGKEVDVKRMILTGKYGG